MLTELVVHNLGVIDDMSLTLGRGMTVVTGETGAGKTLLVGAIDLLTGGRADASLVRPGATEAEIQGRFLVDDTETVVRRVIPRDGRSRVYIDRQLATVAALGELGANLIDLHGQHAHQSLLRASVQRAALDPYGDVDTSRLEVLLDDLRSTETALADMGGDTRARNREIDLLRYQIAEVDAAAITDLDEDQHLDIEESELADAAAHIEAAVAVAGLLGADGPVSDGLGRALAELGDRPPLSERIYSVAAEVADIAEAARRQLESIEENPARLDEIRERRALLKDLRRKYGDALGDVMTFAADTRERLAVLVAHDELAAVLDARRASIRTDLEMARAEARAARVEAAPGLAAAVESHLFGLAMPGARLEISVDGEAGERVAFRIAVNAGHEPLPLSKVASGGELARTMLALRLVLSAGPPTLVFDEVDAGVGGEAANRVGASLAALTPDHQVLVVTHLAQVAAFADGHAVVSKITVDGITVSGVHMLDDDERVVELSRMLSGSPHSSTARQHAEELLAAGRAARNA